MSNQFDVLCVGNANIDAFLTIHDASVHCRLDKKECELCIAYGEKILVDNCEFLLGGGASNVAVGLSKMGFSSALCAEIGDDEFSQKILKTLAREKIDISHLIQTKGAPSSFSIGIHFKGERTLFVKHTKRAHNFIFDNLETKWVYLGGLGQEWEAAYHATFLFLQKDDKKLAFAPGTTQIRAGIEKISEVLKRVNILFLNKEESESLLVSKKQGDVTSVKVLLNKLQDLGPKTVVVTDSSNGTYALDEFRNAYYVGIIPCTVVEKTGAGDAFAAGFLAATMQGLRTPEALKWGTINSASVIGKVGAQPGLLTKEEVTKKLAENSNLQAEEI